VSLTPAIENVIFNPAVAAGLRAVFRVDTSVDPRAQPAFAAAEVTQLFTGVTGSFLDATVSLTFDGFAGAHPLSGPPVVPPGAQVPFASQFPAPSAELVRKLPGEGDAQYGNRLNTGQATGYTVRGETLGRTVIG